MPGRGCIGTLSKVSRRQASTRVRWGAPRTQLSSDKGCTLAQPADTTASKHAPSPTHRALEYSFATGRTLEKGNQFCPSGRWPWRRLCPCRNGSASVRDTGHSVPAIPTIPQGKLLLPQLALHSLGVFSLKCSQGKYIAKFSYYGCNKLSDTNSNTT